MSKTKNEMPILDFNYTTKDEVISQMQPKIGSETVKILLVEDNKDFANIVKHILILETHPRFEITHAVSLEEAIHNIQEKSFDLILLDLGLPDSRDLHTFDQIAALKTNIPIVILSAMDDERLALNVVKKGAQDYVVKSDIDGKIFIRILKYALERHSQRKQVCELNERLEKLSFSDPLTSLLNRRGLQRILHREWELFNREGSSLIVILLDLDNFKRINDAFGHAVGDIVLQEISKVLNQTIRTTDYAARIGGDEFIILLPNTRPVEAMHFSERIRLAINRNPVVLANGETVRATASFGVVKINHRMPSIDELLEETHGALSKSKSLGKNRVSFDHGEEKVENDILDNLRNGKNFRALKQPIVDFSNEAEVGYEFLTRTNIPGFEMPDEFFNLSREGNILSVVDHRCLEASITASFRIPARYEKHVNLLPSTIANFESEQLNRLFPPETLGGTYYVEISEQQILGDPSYLIPILNEFRNRKIRIAIDDVGFGRSCLESLIVLHPEVIKIDKKLVQNVSHDKNQRDLLKRLLNAVENLGAKIIAEGIENREDFETLKTLGVKYGQGYLWGKPA